MCYAAVTIFLIIIQIIAAQLNIQLPHCYKPCSRVQTGNEVIPGTRCSLYHECVSGMVRARRSCTSPLVYDPVKNYCNYFNEVDCPPDITCEPTDIPTKSPTINPTDSPSLSPVTEAPSAAPVIGGKALEYIASKRVLFEKQVLISYTAAGVSYQSTLYRFEDFMQSLKVMGKEGFGADFEFFLFDSTDDYIYGMVNTAAFLANAMVESISTDSCDEIHEEGINGRYAISNSCGQYKRSYQHETCENSAYSCNVDRNMRVTAVTAAPGARAPPPFMCKPGNSYTGYWDTSTGVPVIAAYSNSNGRTEVEGCCFWGRGSLSTKNVCNIGRLNLYLGKGGAMQNRDVLYPDIDFCADPEATCSSPVANELRWRTGMLEWADRVQRYKDDGWSYENQLKQLVDGNLESSSMRDFITSTSRILSSGCHKRGCAHSYNPDMEIRRLDERIANFDIIINTVLDMRNHLAPPLLPPLPPPPPPSPPIQPSQNNNILQANPSPSVQQTNPSPNTQQISPNVGPTAPPNPPKAPSFFQPPPNPILTYEMDTPVSPGDISSPVQDESGSEIPNLILIEDSAASRYGFTMICTVSAMIALVMLL